MNPQYWSSLQHTLAWSTFSIIEMTVSFVLLAALFIAVYAAEGTRRRYLACTVIRGLGVPYVAAQLFALVVDLLTNAYVDAATLAFNALLWIHWIRKYGDDDFWSGLGRKLKRKLKSLVSGRRPAFAGTSA